MGTGGRTGYWRAYWVLEGVLGAGGRCPHRMYFGITCRFEPGRIINTVGFTATFDLEWRETIFTSLCCQK